MTDIWTSRRSGPPSAEPEPSSPVVAVLLALVCWAALYLGMVVVMVLAVAGNTDSVLEAPDALTFGISAVWTAAAMILATRFAAGVLRRRGVEQVLWLIALPTLLMVGVLTEGLPDPLWPVVLQAALGIGGSIAAVTLWSPSPPRR